MHLNRSAFPFEKPLLRRAIVATFAATAFASVQAYATEIDTGNPDVSIRFDNTVRYTLQQRVESPDPKIANYSLSDEGDAKFKRGDIVSNRLDLLSEFDFIYKHDTGFRISTAAWVDGAYNGDSGFNPALAGSSSYVNHQYSNTTKRFYAGPSGEVLDAFVFKNFDLGNVPVRAKLGRHTLYWGESILLGGNLHSVAYAQSPLDIQKGFATPGAEAKELFRPLNQLSMGAQLTDDLSIAGNYMLQWQEARYPEGGTYLGPVDFAFNGPDRVLTKAGFVYKGAASNPKQSGEYGLSARWSPEWLDGTVGFYYRKFADKLPQVLITQLGTAPTYNLVYADNIDLYGMSLSKNLGGVSVGAEVSYRHNTPLLAQTLGIAPGLPNAGDTKGPRGDTWHALVNGLGVISKTPFFDSASWITELTYSRWDKVLSGENLFNAIGFAPCAGKDKMDGCVTKEFYGFASAFTPTWYQVYPGVDLSAPLTYSVGLRGNAATTFGGNEGLGNYSIGLGADIYQKYRVDLKYIDYVGRYKDNGSVLTSQNGLTTFLKDRGFLSLTFKTTF